MPILKSWGPRLGHCNSFLHRFPSSNQVTCEETPAGLA
jgi:hypothetical protein